MCNRVIFKPYRSLAWGPNQLKSNVFGPNDSRLSVIMTLAIVNIYTEYDFGLFSYVTQAEGNCMLISGHGSLSCAEQCQSWGH